MARSPRPQAAFVNTPITTLGLARDRMHPGAALGVGCSP